MARLLAHDLSIGFASPLASGLSLDIHSGERVAVLAPSGAGKTTLFRTLCGLLDPVAGDVTLDGQSPREHGYPAWRRAVSYLPQEPVLFDGTVTENLARGFLFCSSSFDETAARRLLGRLGLEGKAESLADTLSVGERQRVALARALLLESEFLLLDEPTSALDPHSAQAALDLVAESPAGVLVILHDHSLAERFCDRKWEFDHG